MKKKFKKEYILYAIILIAFILLSTFLGLNHECWADEAHAWLIARDTSIFSLFGKYLHSEGHPALWFLIIKIFQLCGLKYQYFFIIPVTISSLGVLIFLFNSKFKWYLKILLPFTYFIFYQYTVIARGYCIILLLLSLLAILWDKRKEKCIPFTIILILLISGESYTFIIAGSIYLILLYDFYQDIKFKKNTKKQMICIISIFLAFLLTTLYIFPYKTNTFRPRPSVLYNISDSFITSLNNNLITKYLFSVLIYILIFLIFKKNKTKKEIIQLLIITIPLLLFYQLFYYNQWHLGIVFVLFLFLIWIYKLENNKLIIIFLLICSIQQIYWSINTSIYEYNNYYAPHEQVANFIKNYDYKNLNIIGDDFYESGINPYFEKNLYINWDRSISFFYWNKNSLYYKKKPKEYLNDVDIYIVTLKNNSKSTKKNIEEIITGLKEVGEYEMYIFEGTSYFETFKYENFKQYVFVKKGLTNKSTEKQYCLN